MGKKVRETVSKAVDNVLADVFSGICDDDISRKRKLLRQVLARAH